MMHGSTTVSSTGDVNVVSRAAVPLTPLVGTGTQTNQNAPWTNCPTENSPTDYSNSKLVAMTLKTLFK